MSYSIYFSAFKDGKEFEFETKKLIDGFKEHIESIDEFGINLFFDEMASSTIFLDLEKEKITDFSIYKPCGEEDEYIIDLSKSLNLVSFEPGLYGIIIFNKETINHLSEELKIQFVDTQKCYLFENLEEYQNRQQILPFDE